MGKKIKEMCAKLDIERQHSGRNFLLRCKIFNGEELAYGQNIESDWR